MNRLTHALACFVAVLATATSHAAVTLNLVPVDNSSQLTGYNTLDLEFVTPKRDWQITVLFLQLTSGTIYQDPMGSDSPPISEVVNLAPSVQFDTYVGLPNGFVAGGAGDIEKKHGYEFSTTCLSTTFFNTDKNDIGNIPIGRITLSDDAVGTWAMYSSTYDLIYFSHTGSITQGLMAIDSETIFAQTYAYAGIKAADSRTVLLTQYVTDEVREQAGNGYPGNAAYEHAVLHILLDMLEEQAADPDTPGYEQLQDGEYFWRQQDYIYTEAEYLEYLDYLDTISLESNTPSNPEPGALSLLALGSLALLRRRG